MKLRLHRQTLRLRLGPVDLARLATAGELRQTLTPGFTYAVTVGDAWRIRDAGGLHVTLPRRAFDAWHAGDELAIAADVAGVAVSVEKDLPCRDGRDTGDANVFHDLAAPRIVTA